MARGLVKSFMRSVAEERRDVATTVHNVQNERHIVLHNAVDDDVIASGEAAQTGAQIVTPSPHVRIPGQQPKAFAISMLPLSQAM